MTVATRGERRKRRDPTSRIAVLSLGFLLILSEACSLTAADDAAPARSRKARFFDTPTKTFPPRASGPPRPAANVGNYDKSYEEDKRLVHTGPNPLHN